MNSTKLNRYNKKSIEMIWFITGNKRRDKIYYFQRLKTITPSWREIYRGILALDDALEKQMNLKDEIDKFKESKKPENQEKKE